MTRLHTAPPTHPHRDDNNNSSSSNGRRDDGDRLAGKYLLRPRSVRSLRRCDSDWSLTEGAATSRRPKSRPAPLSKYRRKTANTRERCRMRQINVAFEKLRGMLPSWSASRRGASEMTKITTLKHACSYIRSLQDLLAPTCGDAQTQQQCSWLFSGMLDTATSLLPDTTHRVSADKSAGAGVYGDADTTELLSLLCDSSDSGVFGDAKLEESLSYLSAPCDAEDVAALLLLESPQPATCWHDQTHAQFAIC